MGKPTGFQEFQREVVPYRDPVERANDFPGDLHRSTCRASSHARCALHGLRSAVLPVERRLPDRQSHSRVERPDLPRPLARRPRPVAQDEQLSRVHRARMSRTLRGSLRPRHHQSASDDQKHRKRNHRPGLCRRLGRSPNRRHNGPEKKWPSSAADPPD